jgi:hypothetical protein
MCLRSGPEADDIIMSEEKNLHAGDQNTEELNSDKNIENSTEETVEQPTVEEKSKELPVESPANEVEENIKSPEVATAVETVEAEVEPETIEEVAETPAAETTEATVDVVAETPTTEVVSEPETIEEVAETPIAETTEATVDVAAETPTTDESSEPATEVVSKDKVVAEAESEEDEDHDHHDDHEIIDYSNHSREALVEAIEELNAESNFRKIDAILTQIEPLFNEFEDANRQSAMDKFIADGGEEGDFEYRHDHLYNRFDASLRLIKDKKSTYYRDREASKERNYQKKEEILAKLRALVDEEGTTSLNPIKALQEEWKNIGQVPNQHNKTLWANYNALLDRFYNNRHILFELKELDRKKNQEAKTELCEKAEALDQMENLKDAIIHLNELHEEYKNIGPVPKEVQEELWQRFKDASDKIYHKRKEYLDSLKGELNENYEKKKVLAAELAQFAEFDSDRINKWNAKTKEILAVQKKWDAIGGLPKEHAKEINKIFWGDFKKFFNNKNEFFKKLEGLRQENLQKKEELITRADALKDNTDWDATAEKFKGLQSEWKDLGPVPEKLRNSIYEKFKAACDAFFNNRRANLNKAESEYVDNLKKKEALVQSIADGAASGKATEGEMDEFLSMWQQVGFVPRGAMKTIENKFSTAVDKYIAALGLEEQAQEQILMKVELGGLGSGPNADRKLMKKEGSIRRQIQDLEDNISLWNNNLSFFANSKTADKLKAEFDEKIEKAKEEVDNLKKQLRMVRSM